MRSGYYGMSGNFYDGAVLNRQLSAVQELRQFDFAHKAKALRVFFVCRRKARFPCDSSHLRLFQFSNREQGIAKLVLVNLTQKIALVLVAVSSCQQAMLTERLWFFFGNNALWPRHRHPAAWPRIETNRT